ncbi:MAG: hypothetical protein ACI8Z5_002624 [Lentimonas sp.]|jgi:hypothetical protein
MTPFFTLTPFFTHLWPANYTRKVLRVRWLRKLPFFGRRFFEEYSSRA